MSSDDHPGDLPEEVIDRLEGAPDPRESRSRVEDTENLNIRRSLERIQAHLDLITNAQSQLIAQPGEGIRPRLQYHEAIRAAIAKLEPWLRDSDIETDHEYWSGIHLGEMEVAPPAPLAKTSRAEAVAALGRGGLETRRPAESQRRQFTGLESIMNTEPLVEFDFSGRPTRPVQYSDLPRETRQDPLIDIHTPERGDTALEIVITKRQPIPLPVLNRATSALTMFCQEIGLEASAEQGRGFAAYG